MAENNYEEYKKNLSRSEGLRRGKVCAVIGICFLLYTLWILPFHAGNVHEVRGDEIKAGKAYYPEQVYYIEDLQILCTKTNTDNDQIYCIAKFYDCDQNGWIISFTPGRDEQLAERIKLFGSMESRSGLNGYSYQETSENGLNPTVSGYFLMEYLEDLSFEADSFYSVYGRSYADAEGLRMINLNAKYLCEGHENYTLQALLRPGIPLGSFVCGGLSGVIYGIILLAKNRPRKAI